MYHEHACFILQPETQQTKKPDQQISKKIYFIASSSAGEFIIIIHFMTITLGLSNKYRTKKKRRSNRSGSIVEVVVG